MKNWKTTVSGLVFAGLNLGLNGVTIKQILVSAAVAALGMVAKDHDVTGGDREQESN